MKKELIKELLTKFENACYELAGIECWSARDLQLIFGYSEWRNFFNAIEKAQKSCQAAEVEVAEHFVDINKMIQVANGGTREVNDIALSRYACYLIAQNGDPAKIEVAFAQSYFAVQTRKQEIIEQRLLEHERLKAREKLSQTEKQLSGILYERGIDNQGFAVIRSKGDKALFKLSTKDLKKKIGIPENRAVADFLPIISIKAKDLAAEMTGLNVQNKDLEGQQPIEKEHIDNNSAVRKMLLGRGIYPEELPSAEDVKKLEKRLKIEEKQSLTKVKKSKKK